MTNIKKMLLKGYLFADYRVSLSHDLADKFVTFCMLKVNNNLSKIGRHILDIWLTGYLHISKIVFRLLNSVYINFPFFLVFLCPKA